MIAAARRVAAAPWAVAIAVAAAAYLTTARTDDVAAVDNVWLVQVTDRVAHGDVLYRDVFYGAPPLAVYLAAPLVLAFGPHVLLAILAAVACLVAGALLGLRIAEQLGAGRSWLLAAAVAILVAPPVNLYQPLAALGALGCFTLALTWLERRRGGVLLAAGVAAGVATVAKQNVGLLVLAALLVAVALECRPGRRVVRPAALALAGFAVPVVAALVPVLVLGGWSDFVDYVLVKRRYLAEGGGVGGPSLASLVHLVEHPSLRNASNAYVGSQFLVLLAAGLLIVAALRARRAERRVVVAAVFAAAFAGTLFPWPAVWRVQLILPALLPVAAVGLRSLGLGPRALRVGAYAACLYLLVGFVQLAVVPSARLASGHREFSSLPALEGVIVAPQDEARLERRSRELAAAARGEELFLVAEGASFYYLAAKIENPTPFDYTWATTFGAHGERDVIARLRSGDLRRVCVAEFQIEPRLRPQRLLAYVRTNLRPGPRIGPCVLYSRE